MDIYNSVVTWSATLVFDYSMNLIIYILFLTFLVLALLVCMAFALTGARERLSVRDYARLRAEQDAFVTVDGYEHHFEDVGPRDGPALVLVHGFAGSLFTWRNQRQPLLDAGYRLLLVDLLGFGGSQRVAAPVYDTRHHAALVLGVMDKLEIREAGVLGHSYGGRIAMQMALLAPERVGAIVAISPEAFAVARPPIARAVSPPLLGYALAFYSTSPQLVRAGLKYSSGNRPWLTDAIVTGYSQPLYVRGNVAAQIWQSKSPKDGDRPVPRHGTARLRCGLG